METNIIPNEVDYFSIPALSKSALDQVAISPANYRHWLENPKKPTPAMEFGTLVHEAILEPEKLMFREFQEKKNKALINNLIQARNISKALFDSIYGKLFKDGLAEKIYLCLINLESFKCKIDYIRPKDGIIIDVKTTADSSEKAFLNSVLKYRYHVQEALYREIAERNGITINHFIFIVIEKKEPCLIRAYMLNDEFRQKGTELYTRDLETYIKCKESGEWPDNTSASEIQLLEYPRWAS